MLSFLHFPGVFDGLLQPGYFTAHAIQFALHHTEFLCGLPLILVDFFQCRFGRPLPGDAFLKQCLAARQVLREAYTAAGRPDAYHDCIVSYETDDQFGFAARVDGLVAREQPAACLLLGPFFAESLLLAEAGNRAGAVLVAGTAMPHQLPFLVVACDHVLIGEEFFAASAYLADDPVRQGSLAGQDRVKYGVMTLLCAGALLGAVAGATGWTGAVGLLSRLLAWLGGGG